MYDPDWFNKAVSDKVEANKRAAHQRHFERMLRYDISKQLEIAVERVKNRTRYKVEVKPNFSSIDVHLSHPDWKSAELFDMSFKLEARHDGIFLVYEAHIKAQFTHPNPTILSSKDMRVDQEPINEDKIIEWFGTIAELSIQSLSKTKYA
jgi:hypothetical protein